MFGAGHAGLAFAIHAAHCGARVVVVDRSRPSRKIGEVIEAVVEAPLQKLGIWLDFLEQGHLRSSGTVSRWSGSELQERNALVDPFGGGWFVDRRNFDGLLIKAAERAGVVVTTACGHPMCDSTGVTITVPWGRVFAPFAIEATGRHGAAVAPPMRCAQDDLVALAAYIQMESVDFRFRLEATLDGWWYAAPLPGNRIVITLMTLIRLLPRSRVARQEFWAQALRETTMICDLAGDSAPSLGVHPAAGAIRCELSGDRWLAVGDAGASYDPLHGLGVVAALTKGIAAAALLTSGASLKASLDLYTDRERNSFASYQATRRRLYAEGRLGRPSAFWRDVSPT